MCAPIVYVVDDDTQLREATSRLLRSLDYSVKTYASAREFLDHFPSAAPGCLVLDLSMPEMDGLELQEVLSTKASCLPIIFVSGHGDIPASVKAMKAGAVDFLQKPFEDEALIAAVQAGLEKSKQSLAALQSIESDWEIYNSLTPRQKEVCLMVAQGLLNKQIGGELGLAEGTVKLHRSFVMQKLKVNSAADLVKLVQRLRNAGRIQAS